MLITTAAGLTGSLAIYLLGRKGGEMFLNAYLKRFPKHRESIEENIDWIRNMERMMHHEHITDDKLWHVNTKGQLRHRML